MHSINYYLPYQLLRLIQLSIGWGMVRSKKFARVFYSLSVLFNRVMNNKIFITKNHLLTDYLGCLPSSESIITTNEAITLYSLVQHVKNLTGEIIEIGTWRGGTTLLLANAVVDSNMITNIHTIDPYIKKRDKVSKKYYVRDSKKLHITHPISNYTYIKQKIKEYGFDDFVFIHKNYSKNIARLWYRPVKLLFIDGDHTYTNVKIDTALWKRFVIPNGYLLLHDTALPFNLPGPRRVVQELKKEKDWTFLRHIDSCALFQKSY